MAWESQADLRDCRLEKDVLCEKPGLLSRSAGGERTLVMVIDLLTTAVIFEERRLIEFPRYPQVQVSAFPHTLISRAHFTYHEACWN